MESEKYKARFKAGMIPLSKHIERANKLWEGWGVTDLYSSGDMKIDSYLGGGIGRHNGYEIVLLWGRPGSGKSTFGLNLMLDPIMKGKNVMLACLEDDPADVVNRLRNMTEGTIDKMNNVFFCEDQEGYTLEQALSAIETWFKACDVVLLDHAEYLFAGSVGQTERDKFSQQEIWMRRLNTLMKQNEKTIVIIQHSNKTKDSDYEGIKGSSAFQQTATKVIKVARDDDKEMVIDLQKTRFTRERFEPLKVENVNFLIRAK